MRARCSGVLSASLAAAILAWPAGAGAQGAPPAIDGDDIGGVVTGPNGPEAGVWVIAETTRPADALRPHASSPTTEGRFVVPDLPKATYSVWVRGYGLVDSEKVKAEPGRVLTLTAAPAPSRGRGGALLPGDLLVFDAEDPAGQRVRRQERHPGQGHPAGLAQRHEEQRLHRLPSARPALDPHDPEEPRASSNPPPRRGCAACSPASPASRWSTSLAGELGGVPFKYFGEWTDRIAKGELPQAKPQRPQGVERNIVVTTWDWLDEKHYLHDLISSDRRHPTVNAYGPLFGSPEYSTDIMPILDPKTHTVDELHTPGARPGTPEALGPGSRGGRQAAQPSPYWGEEKIWNTQGQQPQRHVRTRRAASGSRRPCAAPTTPTSARRARITPRRSCSRSSAATARSRCSIRRP